MPCRPCCAGTISIAELARHFRRKVEFPPEDIEGVSDEQYVRNVVDVLYRTQKGQRTAAIAA